MYTETEGIILRQVKTVGGRRMVSLFSKKFGKISAGTGINEKGKGKSALAMRPFTKGRYELFKTRDNYSINSAEVIKSFYKIGEDVDKFMCASYALELTDKVTAEGEPAPGLFNLLMDFLSLLEKRREDADTLLLAFEVRLLKQIGFVPDLNVRQTNETLFFDIANGHFENGKNIGNEPNASLILETNFDIVSVLQFFANNPPEKLKKLTLEPEVAEEVKILLRKYISYHLGVEEMKSEMLMDLSE